MKRVTLIRFGTYVAFVICLFTAHQRHFIEVRLPTSGLDVEWWWGQDPHHRAYPKFFGRFSETRLAGREIAKEAKLALAEFGLKLDPSLWFATIELTDIDGADVWLVTVQSPDAEYIVYVPDSGGKPVVSRHERRQPNQTPQHNAGSRPFSHDSPASESPSSLSPRG